MRSGIVEAASSPLSGRGGAKKEATRTSLLRWGVSRNGTLAFDAPRRRPHNPRLMKFVYLAGYLAMPAALVVHFWFGRGAAPSWEPTLTFILSGLSIVPLAGLMGEATEHLAQKTGPTWGGLLNATFGNAAELIIGIVSITKGLNDIAKATLAGSILGNLLLVSGGAMLVGGWGRERQTFSKSSANTNAGLLTVAVAGMLLPAIFHFSYSGRDPHLLAHETGISIGTSVVLLLVYGLGLLFTLRTYGHIFSPSPARSDEDPRGLDGSWSVKKSVLVLLAASAAVAVFSELLVGAVEPAAHRLGLNYLFIGVILLAIIGNASEHYTAILLAHRNDMDTAMSITFQSSLQIALFVTPILVLLSSVLEMMAVGSSRRMDLVFSPLEVVGVFLSVAVVVTVSRNGQSTWFEGILLLAVYAILGITFFYIPTGHGPNQAEHIYDIPSHRSGSSSSRE